MVRKAIDFGFMPRASHWSSNDLGTARYQGFLKDIRDNIRAVLDPASDGAKWSVSDIVIWDGTSNYKGCLFQVIHQNAGEPTGHCWTFVMHYDVRSSNSNMTMGAIIGNQDIPTIEAYLESPSTANSRDQYGISVFYNDQYTRHARFTGTETGAPTVAGNWQLQGDASINGKIIAANAANDWTIQLDAGRRLRASDVIVDTTSSNTLTISAVSFDRCMDTGFANHKDGTSSTGNDWDAIVPTNPYSALANFMPDDSDTVKNLLGVSLDGGVSRAFDSQATWAMCVTDDEKPCMGIYCVGRNGCQVDTVMISGKIIKPFDNTDTYTGGWVAATINPYNSSVDPGKPEYLWTHFRYGSYPGGDGGGVATEDLKFADNFKISNERNTDDEYYQNVAYVIDDNEAKGYIDTDLMRVVGAAYGSYGMSYANEDDTFEFVKLFDKLSVPWVKDEAQWPLGIRFQNKPGMDKIWNQS